jgi:hemoglobin
VARFYADARQDALLGPVFAAAVQDWPHHLAALTGFWAAQLRGRGSFAASLSPCTARWRRAARLRG